MQHKFRRAVIYHSTDMDGWASAWVVRKHLMYELTGEKNQELKDIPGITDEEIFFSDDDVLYWGYNYGKPTEKLEQKLDECMKEGYTIYMVDITLPDYFMEKYAERIIWIDHHHSRIEQAKETEWVHRLKENHSRTHMEGYKCINADVEVGLYPNAPKIAACELCWLTLFPEATMPRFIYLAGRYDVWDHDKDVLALNAYTRYMLNTGDRIKPIFTLPTFERLERDYDLHTALREGREIMKWKEVFDASESQRSVTTHMAYGVKIAIVNRGGINSQFFKAIVEKDPEIKAVGYYVYDISANVYRMNFFQIDLNFNVLDFMENFRSHPHEGSNITSMGGHIGAGGFVTSNIYADLASHLE